MRVERSKLSYAETLRKGITQKISRDLLIPSKFVTSQTQQPEPRNDEGWVTVTHQKARSKSSVQPPKSVPSTNSYNRARVHQSAPAPIPIAKLKTQLRTRRENHRPANEPAHQNGVGRPGTSRASKNVVLPIQELNYSEELLKRLSTGKIKPKTHSTWQQMLGYEREHKGKIKLDRYIKVLW